MTNSKTVEQPDITELAKWFLAKEPMTHKKLQKLCYYAVAWGYALMDRQVFKNDTFEAWVHGPVSPILYKLYKGYGWNAIEKTKSEDTPKFSDDVEELLEAVWRTYGDKDGDELEAISHSEDPWKEARIGVDEDERGNHRVNPKTMKVYYNSIYTGDDK